MQVICNLDRVTYDGTRETLPMPWRPVLIWLPYTCIVGYRAGQSWCACGGSLMDIDPGDSWAYLGIVMRAAREASR